MTGKVDELKQAALAGATAERRALRFAFMSRVASAIVDTGLEREALGTPFDVAIGEIAREMGLSFASVVAFGHGKHPGFFAEAVAAHFERGVRELLEMESER